MLEARAGPCAAGSAFTPPVSRRRKLFPGKVSVGDDIPNEAFSSTANNSIKPKLKFEDMWVW
jgi:hypothetical protein